MKILILVINLLFFNIAFSDYYENKIVVKLNENYNNNSQYHRVLSSIDSNLKINNLINKNILAQISTKFDTELRNSNRNLDRIYVVEFSKFVDIYTLSRKLSNLEELSYAEPLYKRNITYIPNDTLLYEQYYLINTYVYDAWKYLYDNNLQDSLLSREIVIGITDTGIDFEHIELMNMIYQNPGEIGTDENGNDKRSNGIDDDNNGFIDDYQGWDFGSDSSETGYDNTPKYGHPHGSHVAGIISAEYNNTAGIAGIGINMRILPVKIASDSYYSTSVEKSYDGILYAALLGADVINCSWGGSGYSEAEQEIINQATEMGSLVIAAAGNSGLNAPQYPASYKNVISVAATNFTDGKTSFSNLHSTVDISAPGYEIISTIPNNGYDTWSGTSMAAPVVSAIAGWAARRFPDLSPFQIGEILKSASSKIERNDAFYPGLLGAGIVNLHRVLSDSTFYSADIINIDIIADENTYEYGDTLSLNFDFANYLGDLHNLKINIYEPNYQNLNMLSDSVYADLVKSEQILTFNNEIKFIIAENEQVDKNVQLVFYAESDEYSRYFITDFIINPSYKDFANNNITTTFNSRGNIAYNDYSSNTQGSGFSWLDHNNLLFEGAFIAGIPSKIDDVARNESGSSQNRDFQIAEIIHKTQSDGELHGSTKFYNIKDTNSIGLTILQSIVQSNEYDDKNTIYLKYTAINESDEFHDSLYLGLYFDWDIGPSGQDNQAFLNQEYFSGIIYNTLQDTLPYCAVTLLNERDKFNFYAIDNPGADTSSIGVYDGFSDSEKWLSISSGVSRTKSSITDASFVISAGPFAAKPGDSISVVFAISVAENEPELLEILDNIQQSNHFSIPEIVNDKDFNILNIFPNPGNDLVTVDLNKNVLQKSYSVAIHDITGKSVKEIYAGNSIHKGLQRIRFSVAGISQGSYILSIRNGEEIIDSKPFIILK